MAKTSKIVRDRQRREVVARHAERRAPLKEAVRSAATPEERADARRAAAAARREPDSAAQPRRRPRGHLRKFGLSRVRLRRMAHDGQLPGIRRASW